MAVEKIRERAIERDERLKHIRHSLLGAKYELEQAAGDSAAIHLHSFEIKLAQALNAVNGLLMSDALKL